MARYVILRFEDNGQAEAFIKSVQQNDVFFSHKNEDGTGSYGYIDKVRPVGLFAGPTLYCECPPHSETDARSQKYGWWVHRKCSKPRRGNWQHPHNLLDPEASLRPGQRSMYLGVIEPNDQPRPDGAFPAPGNVTLSVVEPRKDS